MITEFTARNGTLIKFYTDADIFTYTIPDLKYPSRHEINASAELVLPDGDHIVYAAHWGSFYSPLNRYPWFNRSSWLREAEQIMARKILYYKAKGTDPVVKDQPNELWPKSIEIKNFSDAPDEVKESINRSMWDKYLYQAVFALPDGEHIVTLSRWRDRSKYHLSCSCDPLIIYRYNTNRTSIYHRRATNRVKDLIRKEIYRWSRKSRGTAAK